MGLLFSKPGIMKKIILSITILFFVIKSFSQTNVSILSKQAYLEKSRNQKTTAWVLLGGGAALTAVGAIVMGSSSNSDDFTSSFNRLGTGAIIAGLGGTAMIASIPFFINSGKNARRAASISFNDQNILVPFKKSFALKSQPVITLKIML